MKAGKEYLVQVHGNIRCKKVEDLIYKVKITEYHGRLVADFYRPKGRKIIIRHYITDINLLDRDVIVTDESGTEILIEVA